MALADAKHRGARIPRPRDQQFFEKGVGRITGVILKDTGERDEHNMEPLNIYSSSPASMPPESASRKERGQGSPTANRATSLDPRRISRISLARTSTPKHTNIGSPKRSSTKRALPSRLSQSVNATESPSGEPPQSASRVLNFSRDDIYESIEGSPFKPRHNLRRSPGSRQTGTYPSPETARQQQQQHHDANEVSHMQLNDDYTAVNTDDGASMMIEDDGYAGNAVSAILPEDSQMEDSRLSSPRSRRTTSRKSGVSVNQSLTPTASATKVQASGRKRGRSSHNETSEQDINQSQTDMEDAAQTRRKRRSGLSNVTNINNEDSVIDPSLLAPQNEETIHVIDQSLQEGAVSQANEKRKRGRPKGSGKKAADNANSGLEAAGGAVGNNTQRSRANGRGGSVGPSSHFALRATTPFEDAGAFTRSGRPVIGRLKYWANERVTYKNGVVDGIIRADVVEETGIKSRRGRKKTKKRKGSGHRDDEDSDTQSILPDDWERELGVISGDVANWDPNMQEGDPHDLIHEDLAHAESCLEKREVGGSSSFRYSKILTIPFFGAGVVELPPGGCKSTKNSRKNQLAFFVHQGKVLVEVNPPGPDAEPNQFSITRGGVWIVPRGNDYSVTNESATKNAVVFFCQGSDVSENIPS